jgi:hypothetical protein
VLNHPDPLLGNSGTPGTGASRLNLNINDTNFGLFTGENAKSNVTRRELQAQLRFNF